MQTLKATSRDWEQRFHRTTALYDSQSMDYLRSDGSVILHNLCGCSACFYRMQEHDSEVTFNNKSDDISRIALKKGKNIWVCITKSDSYFSRNQKWLSPLVILAFCLLSWQVGKIIGESNVFPGYIIKTVATIALFICASMKDDTNRVCQNHCCYVLF